jgi:hypothetical protein
MPVITLVLFFTFVAMLFVLNNILRTRKKFKAAEKFGIDNFDIDLPTGATVNIAKSGLVLPAFNSASDAENFFMLITPYIGSLSVTKREYIRQHANDLKNELKMNKAVYQFFLAEYKQYQGLSDDEAAQKWSDSSA